MAIYQEQISKRLNDFLNNHVEHEDDGDAENGPHLSSTYSGPDWAINLAGMAEEPSNYMSMVVFDNIYSYEEPICQN